MIIDERDNNRMKIVFSCSPLDECLSSLHAMSNPDHHTECCDWIREQYRQLSPELLQQLQRVVADDDALVRGKDHALGSLDHFIKQVD